jgi:trans-aconitate methyltransferase
VSAEHWDEAYAAGDTGKSWYQQSAPLSARLIAAGGAPTDAVIDIGGGASTLVDGLLDGGYSDVTVLDVSTVGIDLARARLGDAADLVTWVVGDLLAWRPQRQYDVWHDRAVLHFLTDPADRLAYRDLLDAATAPGSRVVLGGFAPDGPESCSGLAVHRADAAGLLATLGEGFVAAEELTQEHRTPAGAVQHFQWVRAIRVR